MRVGPNAAAAVERIRVFRVRGGLEMEIGFDGQKTRWLMVLNLWEAPWEEGRELLVLVLAVPGPAGVRGWRLGGQNGADGEGGTGWFFAVLIPISPDPCTAATPTPTLMPSGSVCLRSQLCRPHVGSCTSNKLRDWKPPPRKNHSTRLQH